MGGDKTSHGVGNHPIVQILCNNVTLFGPYKPYQTGFDLNGVVSNFDETSIKLPF